MYIDTHNDFQANRVAEMAKTLRSQVMKSLDRDPEVHKRHFNEFNQDKILQRVSYLRILNDSYQNLLRDKLEDLIEAKPKLKLIIMDTFCEFLKGSGNQGFNERRQAIAQLVMTFQRVAARHNICIVLLNCMKAGKREFIQHKVPGVDDG